MRWRCPSVCLSVRPVSVIDSEVFVTRHSLLRAKGEVLLFYCMFFFVLFLFGQRFLDNPRAGFTPKFACGRTLVLDVGCVFSPFWGLAAPEGGKRGK